MTKSKLTLIVDGNWLLMSRLAVMNGRYPNMDELLRELKLLMIRSINLVLKTFPNIDNVIFVADGGSWRNDIANVPQFLINEICPFFCCEITIHPWCNIRCKHRCFNWKCTAAAEWIYKDSIFFPWRKHNNCGCKSFCNWSLTV